MSRSTNSREIAVSRGGPPIRQPANFTELQRNMEDELERRRKDWEKEVEQMSEEFFNVKIVKKEGNNNNNQDGGAQVSSQVVSAQQRPLAAGTEILSLADSNEVYTVLPDGSKVFRQRFNVQGFEPGDLQVKVDGGAIRVTAKHEEKLGGRNASSRQFNRQVDVPENVNPDKLVSYLSPDGILTLEAPVEATSEVKPKVRSTALEPPPSVFGPRSASPLAPSPPQYTTVVRSVSPAAASGTVYNSPVLEDTPHGQMMKMNIKMGGEYNPEDVSITLHDHKVSVKAKHEENQGGRSSKREFSREFDVPKPLYQRSFRAGLNSGGQLVLCGSVRDNGDQRAMTQVVYNAMPIHSKPCTVKHA